MTALFYLLRRRAVNSLKQLWHNKTKFAAYTFIFLMLILVIILSSIQNAYTDSEQAESSGINQLVSGLIFLILVVFAFISAIMSGTKRGSRMFTMADVHFIFPAPLPNASILYYGMINTARETAVSAFFLFFQYQNLRSLGYGLSHLCLLLLIYILMIFISQLLSTSLYLMLLDHEDLKSKLRSLSWLIPAILLGVYIFLLLADYAKSGELLFTSAFTQFMKHPLFIYFPFIGWISTLMNSVLLGWNVHATISLVLTLAAVTYLIHYIGHSKADFYEDAMQLSDEANMRTNPKVKQGKLEFKEGRRNRYLLHKGFSGGWGASAFFYKQWLLFRRTRPWIFGPASLLYLLGMLLVVYLLKLLDTLTPAQIFFAGVSVMLLAFFWHAMASSVIEEFEKPAIYTAPVPSVSKLAFASASTLLRLTIDIATALFVLTLYSGVSLLFFPPALLLMLSVYLVISASQILTYRLMGSIKGIAEMILLLFIQMMALTPTLIALVLTFMLSTTPGLIFILLLFTLINCGFFAISLPIGISILNQGLER